ncbi:MULTISPECIES: carbon-nitrogen hydrolase family protein [Prochlorococcus]|uniref:Nitrilase-like protein n=1 Tax=Prochlorococcus marinus (strain SARG / CCMP1375 / SS120) TaxID=167539 RepID=Q7VBP7_PROMA|nr:MULTISPECIES: carbon-nitrogen hydrolase family protein [Prochlorococcus]AAQ00090.1 Nitrilase-like protein [Prochlorococcus marinus subsp. marinus str. CCMP1375]KGG13886.1 Omega amidase Nit2 [Prochlorococcus marinus str. LG]KGG19019.1 Omega amidase Nit2 [Prochlorococcus marinus str. SS2]KGG23441.1 Omega amidase Nit2 [Prochlorococcus marinus str. SS35]KGG32323.1 Omega amidase Nit2 [Prochlorococcus marinus str. SS51]
MADFLAAAVQITSTSDIEANFSLAEEQIELASRRGAELVGLPENFAFLGNDQQRLDISASLAEQCSQFLVTMARRYQIFLLGGGFPVPAGDGQRTLNRAELVGRDGQLLGRYDKIHLFDVDLPDGNKYRESETIISGKKLPSVINLPGLCKVGISICYDVRFPELYRHLVNEGAELLMIPATFTAFTGKDHWQVLLQSRAIENTAYVVAPAQTGLHYGRRQSHGHAMIIDPWGTVLADAGVQQGSAIAPVDTSRVQSIRNQMPCLKHRKPELF